MQNVFPGGLTRIDTTATVPLGSLAEGPNGEVYIYLQGVALTVRGAAVVYNAAFASTLTILASRGPVAFAMAAVLANQFGWYQISGRAPGRSAAAVVANAILFATATPGAVDDTVAAASQITGAFSVTAPGSATDMTVQTNYAHMAGLG